MGSFLTRISATLCSSKEKKRNRKQSRAEQHEEKEKGKKGKEFRSCQPAGTLIQKHLRS